jgi:hypothetical protein
MMADFLFYSLKVYVLGFHCLVVSAQDCPKNIDVESGTFEEWTCYVVSARKRFFLKECYSIFLRYGCWLF